MKTLLKFFFLMAGIGFLAGCNKTEALIDDETVDLKKAQVEVTVPFEVNLLGEINDLIFDDQECLDGGYPVRAVVETSGNATHMGKVTLTFAFCTGGPPDPAIPNSIYTFAASSFELIAANGDKLFLYNGGGAAILGTNVPPDYVTDYWTSIAIVTGGTGRFEGASGELQMNDYCTSIDDYTHHHWTGEITLVKGEK
ncbi:MAG: hypothetical protein K0B15_14395 [Lentimicrobium sp.]|nr:hypothetical protein [Lentimicrobium sp.]